jgi:predicted AlkP superfamily phosphohydrolase/phosphomutase
VNYCVAAMGRPQLTVIGLDAATFDVIDPMIEAGQLPNLKRIFDEGTRGILHSTIHPLTTQAWATMLTGVNAGRHGMWDFSDRDESGYRLRLVNGSYRRAPAVWEMLTAADRSVGIVNVPFTWPAQPVNGFLLAGIDAASREAGMTYPKELLRELRRRFDFDKLEFDHALPLDKDGRCDVELVRRACEQRVEVVRWLVERYEPELLFVVFMSADHIHHLCWPEWDSDGLESRVAEVYRILDEAVGGIRELAGDGDVMVVSDHGGGSLNGIVNLNAWLAEEGFLTYATGHRAMRPDEVGRHVLHWVLEQRRKLPAGLRNFFKQRFPRLRERAHELKEYTVIDWERTQAFAYGIFGNVVLNVRGREAKGVVEPGEEYERVRDAIAARAMELRDANTGEQIVKAVHRREDLFDGPHIGKIPDVLIEFKDYAWLGKGNLIARTPTIWDKIPAAPGSQEEYVGSHRPEGIIALAGPSAAVGVPLDASIEDVAPTLMYLMGEPVPQDLEGRVLEEALDPDTLDARPPQYGEKRGLALQAERGYTAAEGSEVEDRLRSLGYIE